MQIILGIFFLAHGMVHLLYAGQSWRLFELRPELTWPDEAWLFSKLFGDEITRVLATVFLVLAALGFAAGGLGLFIQTDWWRVVTVSAAALSSLVFFVFWNGKFQGLPDQGFVGILINLAILGVVLILKWPA